LTKAELFKLRLSVPEINSVIKEYLLAHPIPKYQAEVKVEICNKQIEKILLNYNLTPKKVENDE